MKSKYMFEKMELDGEIVAVPIGEDSADFHAVLNLNEEAMRILELLQKETTVNDIVAQLMSEYSGSEEMIRSMVAAFIQQLRQENLLIE